ncbi:MAG TPA: hypothetical protein VII75_08790 [Thermoanaerobaculia bacterium]|nr:hypothetical protein [Thermoanaerobaculia bacterium]
MTQAVTTLTYEVPEVEAYELVETWRLSELVANFARIHILVTLFDGKPDLWLDFIDRDGTAEEREYDRPFIEGLKQRMADDPALIETMRRLVRDVSSLFAPHRLE